jgi:hypothetical protein
MQTTNARAAVLKSDSLARLFGISDRFFMGSPSVDRAIHPQIVIPHA